MGDMTTPEHGDLSIADESRPKMGKGGLVSSENRLTTHEERSL